MNRRKRGFALFGVIILLFLFFAGEGNVRAASGPSVRTTLTDGSIQRGSKKTFDVWARNSSGEKIRATVKLNGKKIEPTWDDDEKASYTLEFTREGENTVTISASSDGGKKKELTYRITYQKAEAGEKIGDAIWSVEAFTIGAGYVVYPVRMPIYEGETAAEQLLRLLQEHGLVGYYGGTVKSSFYLAYIADGTKTEEKFNNYRKSSSAAKPKQLNLKPMIPAVLVPKLEASMTFFDPNDYEKNWEGTLGEFVITNGSGWMYSVNHVFPNVGFADSYLSDGDVVRVQFTLGYGADIGGFSVMGSAIPDVENQPDGGYFAVANKDELTKTICTALESDLLDRTNVKRVLEDAVKVMEMLDADDAQVSAANAVLYDALKHPSQPETPGNSKKPEQPGSSGNLPQQGGSGNENGSGGATGAGSGSNPPGSTEDLPQQGGSGSENGSGGENNESGAGGETVQPEVPGNSNNQAEPTASYSVDDILSIANGIITWKKTDVGAAPDGNLINDNLLALAGTTPGDWYPIGLSRLGIDDNYDGYLAVIKDQIEERYAKQGKLSAAKATEWHRIALAVLAAGGDPTNIGICDGKPINLIADGTYDRGKTTSLGRQGINGWIWGLITLDSKRYEVPEDAYNSRDDIILEILRQQLADGGFALSGTASDPDITAMAIQALAPYYNSEKLYTYTEKQSKTEVQKTVHQVVEEALSCLSELQLETGDFESWGTCNVESTDQVTVALCCLGIDPLTDRRFIKNGNTLLDGILKYRMKDGGFVHSFTYDPDNPTSLPDRSNTMAGEQTLYTMAALYRQKMGMRTLYDFRPEQDEENQALLYFTAADQKAVDALPEKLTTEQYVLVTSLLDKLNRSEDFDGKKDYLQKLSDAKETIAAIQAEIDSINAEVREKLYPFDRISWKDKKTVDAIVARYQALSEYDRTKILRYEDVLKTKTKIDNFLRGILISVVLTVAAALLAVFLVRRAWYRKNKKRLELEALAAEYEEG